MKCKSNAGTKLDNEAAFASIPAGAKLRNNDSEETGQVDAISHQFCAGNVFYLRRFLVEYLQSVDVIESKQ